MTKARILIALALILLAALFAGLHYRNDFFRVQCVEVASAATDTSTITRILLRNDASRKIEFPLRCYAKTRSEGKPLFSELVVLPPNATLEFDVHPELAGRELPPMIANRSCEAVWRGPFGMERGAWWVVWEGRRVRKSLSVQR